MTSLPAGTEQSARYCSKCGRARGEADQYCAQCGELLTPPAAVDMPGAINGSSGVITLASIVYLLNALLLLGFAFVQLALGLNLHSDELVGSSLANGVTALVYCGIAYLVLRGKRRGYIWAMWSSILSLVSAPFLVATYASSGAVLAVIVIVLTFPGYLLVAVLLFAKRESSPKAKARPRPSVSDPEILRQMAQVVTESPDLLIGSNQAFAETVVREAHNSPRIIQATNAAPVGNVFKIEPAVGPIAPGGTITLWVSTGP